MPITLQIVHMARSEPCESHMSSDEQNPEEKDYVRPSERMFRRSRRAEARRHKSAKGDIRLIVMIINIVVFTALLLVLILFMTQSGWHV